MAGPLDGIIVLDWTQWQMGTVATAMLADLGASVIHIENRVTGDAGRGLWRAEGTTMDLPHGKRAYFETNNRGKKSITVDLTKEKGKEIIYRLARKSDVFVHNFRQGVPERLKLDYETLCQYNPQIVYASASGYGPKGPEAIEPAYDYIGLARSGIMTMVGELDMPPLTIRSGVADQMGAIMTSYGVLAALLARERLGVGQKVDVSHLGSMIALQGLSVGLSLYLEKAPDRPVRKKAANPLWNHYQCQNGKWLVLGMLQPDRQWPALCQALGIENLEKDPRFKDAVVREEHCEEIIAIMDKIFITRSTTEWMKILKEAGDIICTPIQSISDLANDPQVLANEYIIDCHHEVLGPVKVAGLPIQLSKTPGKVKVEAPELGQHTEEILTEIGGYSWEDIAQLRKEEVI